MNQAGRVSMMRGGWKNPYVTDGLVAMWDGEWNAGPGIHDPNATVWVNLASPGEGDFTINSNGSWGDKWFNFAGISASSTAKYSPATIEVVIRLDSGHIVAYDVQHAPAFNGGVQAVVNLIWRSGNGNAGVGLVNNGSTPCASPTSNLEFGTTVYMANHLNHAAVSVPGPAYYNGVASSHTLVNSWQADSLFYIGGRVAGITPYNGYGRLYSLRYHSRALTAAEIAANYAVDKARFNLP